jgi:hypothetical protein
MLSRRPRNCPWDERLQHKNWKVRNDANIDLAALCDSITDPKDARLREFGEPRSTRRPTPLHSALGSAATRFIHSPSARFHFGFLCALDLMNVAVLLVSSAV